MTRQETTREETRRTIKKMATQAFLYPAKGPCSHSRDPPSPEPKPGRASQRVSQCPGGVIFQHKPCRAAGRGAAPAFDESLPVDEPTS